MSFGTKLFQTSRIGQVTYWQYILYIRQESHPVIQTAMENTQSSVWKNHLALFDEVIVALLNVSGSCLLHTKIQARPLPARSLVLVKNYIWMDTCDSDFTE